MRAAADPSVKALLSCPGLKATVFAPTCVVCLHSCRRRCPRACALAPLRQAPPTHAHSHPGPPRSDNAFVAVLKKLGLSADALLADQATLTRILFTHVVRNAISTRNVSLRRPLYVSSLVDGWAGQLRLRKGTDGAVKVLSRVRAGGPQSARRGSACPCRARGAVPLAASVPFLRSVPTHC